MCFASQTPGLCSALISLRLPYPVCTRFVCRVFVCFASQTPGLCSASIFPSAPLPSLHTFYLSSFVSFASQQTPGLYSVFNFPSTPLPTLHTFLFLMFVCFASQTPGLCSAFNLPSAPLPSLHTFYLSCFVCFASVSPVLCSASLLSFPALHSSLFILSVGFALKTVQFYFPWDFFFCSLMRLLAFTVIFGVSFTLSKLCVSEVLSFRSLPFNFVCFLCFVFLLRFIMFFPHFFPRNGFFV